MNKGKNVDELRVRVVAFRDFAADGDAAMQESPFFALPADQATSAPSSTVSCQKVAGTPRIGPRGRGARHEFAVDHAR